MFRGIMHIRFWLIFIAVHFTLIANDPTICLNMIVKDESAVITRCLGSLKSLIDYWVIVDTGSTDGTQKIIKEFMKDVPGELHERPWKNFGHNRNEALSLAKGKGDYLLFIDADEIFQHEPNYKFPKLDKDFYFITTNFNGTHYGRVQLVNNHLGWKWEGVLHEGLACKGARSSGLIKGITNFVYTDGARSKDPKKYEKDALALEEALLLEPKNSRYVFYLAQSYKDAGNYPKALENYQKRIEMKGWDEEVFISMLYSAEMKELMEYPKEDVVKSYVKAFEYRPSRREPLYRLAQYLRKNEHYAHGYVVAKAGLAIPQPKDLLFVDTGSYSYGTLLESSICAYWMGKYQECHDETCQILAIKDLPLHIKECAERNLAFAKQKIKEETVNVSTN